MKHVFFLLLVLPFFGDAQIITTFAGNGTPGFSGDGGPATAAEINGPGGVAIDRNGNMYISDFSNFRVRKISTSGVISTLAGNGTFGYSGDGGPATAAALSNTSAVAVDKYGNVFIADDENNVIRKVNAAGIISTFAGNGSGGNSGDGGPATAAEISYCFGLAVDDSGNVFIADSYNYVIRKVNAAGIITVFAGNYISGFAGDGGPATAARLGYPHGVQVDNMGNVYIGDQNSNRIRKVNPAGIITTIAGGMYPGYAGDGGAATDARLDQPEKITLDRSGNLYFADYGNNCIRKINTSGIISTIAGNDTAGYSGDGGPATAAKLNSPVGVAADTLGNVFIADGNNHRIRKVNIAATGIANISPRPGSISIYPNPATTALTINSTEKITHITITNLLGQTVYTHEYDTQKVLVNVSGFARGVYLVTINGSEIRRFVKE